MRPQSDEPCVNCKNWDGRTKQGCKVGHYYSATMVIWGVCGRGYFERKKRKAKKGEGE